MAKRDYGDGSISQRKDGTWTARVFLGKLNGKQKIKAFYGKTEKEVKKKLKDYQAELIKSTCQEVQKTTLETYMTDWLNNVKRNELKPSSFDRLETTCKHQVFPFIGYLQIHSITPADIQNLVNKLIDKGYSYSTIKKAYNAIDSCFSFAYDRNEVQKNPCVRISLPTNEKKDISDIIFFNDNEITAIEQSALFKYKNGNYKYSNGWYIVFLLYTGLRIGELLALKWENVDLINNCIRVSGNLKQVKSRSSEGLKYIVIEQSPKTKSGNRIIPLANKAIEALTYLQEHKYSEKYVVASKNGKSISARNIDRTFRQILETAKISKKCGVHSLRHTFASMLFKKGVDPKTVSEILGHSDVSITYNIYIHIIQEQKVKAIDLLNT